MERTYRLKRDEAPAEAPSQLPLETALNAEQRAVVQADGGPMLVVAGAGTGKTRTLTWRLARLIERGVPAERILLVTFTNQAAREMTSRAEELIHTRARALCAGTFHSVGRRFVTEYAALLGYPERCAIIDRDDSEELVKQAIGELGANTTSGARFPRAALLLRLLSTSINTGRTVADVLVDEAPQFADQVELMYDVLLRYQNRKQELGLFDFDDLLVLWQRLLHEVPEAAERLSARFEHILVDEYQDTNRLQADIIDRMASVHRNLVVVGDDSQAIYAFRGADYQNILGFPDRYPDCRVFRLEQNYRSSPQILALANASIHQNTTGFAKTLQAHAAPGPKPASVACAHEQEEALFVAQRILELRDEDVGLDRIAVLYRAHAHAIAIELELKRRNIPYVVRSGMRFFEQRHIKDVVACLRLAANPRDELAAARVFRLCDGVGNATANRLAQFVAAHETLAEALANPQLTAIAPKRAQPSLGALREALGAVCSDALREDAAGSVRAVLDRWYRGLLPSLYDTPGNRAQEIEALADYAAQAGGVSAFLDQIALESGLSGEELLNHERGDERVVLSTIHRAKGLEFQAVFLLSMVEERMPGGPALFRDEALEEERRVFYVGVTRAERELYLTRPLQVTIRGERVITRSSRFVEELAAPAAPLFERWRLS